MPQSASILCTKGGHGLLAITLHREQERWAHSSLTTPYFNPAAGSTIEEYPKYSAQSLRFTGGSRPNRRAPRPPTR